MKSVHYFMSFEYFLILWLSHCLYSVNTFLMKYSKLYNYLLYNWVTFKEYYAMIEIFYCSITIKLYNDNN